MANKSIEDSCKDLQVWIERLGKLDERDKIDLSTYFSRNNIWVEALETIESFIGNGAESSIYKSYDEKEVFKFKRSKTDSIKGIVNVLKDALNHNKVFPETYYSLIGFSYEKDVFGVILGQELVKGEFATQEQISNHLKKDGFTIIPTDADRNLLAIKNGFHITDIKSPNAIVANNRVYVIDCCIVKYS